MGAVVVVEVWEAITFVVYSCVMTIANVPKIIAGFGRWGSLTVLGPLMMHMCPLSALHTSSHKYVIQKRFYSLIMVNHKGRFMNPKRGCT